MITFSAGEMKIGDRRVCAEEPAYIIAEVGVNHNGDIELAHKLIDLAADAGADAVKFQTFRTSALVTSDAAKADYQAVSTGSGSQADMLRNLELSLEQFASLARHCASRDVDFISTAFDEQSLEDVLSLSPKCLKWPSGELTNLPFLRQAGKSGLPLILSTGMATLGEVAEAVETATTAGTRELAILHCVSNYPAPIGEQNLRAIPVMGAAFGRPIGFSDHTDGMTAAIAARALGMAILEKHITADRSLPGPDHTASMEPQDFAALVKAIRDVESGLGDGVKRPTPSEMPTRRAARKSLVFARALEAGARIAPEDLTSKRPGDGVSPDAAPWIVGRTLCRSVTEDEPVRTDVFE